MHGKNMGTHKDRTQVSDTYNKNLSSWALRERARLGNPSERRWAAMITEKTGIETTYGIVGRWLKGNYKMEMEKRSLVALCRWRGDESPEHTREWLFGDTLYDKEEYNRVLAWLKTAPKDEVAEIVKEGMKVVFEEEKEEDVQLPLPAIAFQIKDQGINIDTLLEKSLLTDEEQQDAVLYLMGKKAEIKKEVLEDLEYTLKGLIKLHGSRKKYKEENHQRT